MDLNFVQFPANFIWGAAASAYQIEGAWNDDGKGLSIWDHFSHQPFMIRNNDTGDIACGHYHRMPADVSLMRSLGLKAYRFSISWSRVLPLGLGEVNPAGLDFYDRLVDQLLSAGILPLATLYHWDLPQALQLKGGWGVREAADWFAEYSQVVFHRLGDRVPLWATLNEPWVQAFLGHGYGVMAPGIADISLAYRVLHHQLLAHGRTVQLFRAEGCTGRIGIAVDIEHSFPASESEADQAAWKRYDSHYARLCLDPLMRGEYPQELLDWLGAMAPQVHPGDLEIIRQPLDFLGVNYYRAVQVSYDPGGGYLKCRVGHQTAPLRGHTEMGWGIFPDGLAAVLLRLKNEYGNPAVLVSENGCAVPDAPDAQGVIRDQARIDFLRSHLLAAHTALQDGVNLEGYFVWSLMDNFEWAEGYGPRFGLVFVDYPSGARLLKHSYHWYRDVIAANGFYR